MRIALPPEEPPSAMPEGVVRLRIDKTTGLRSDSQSEGIWEYFLSETVPGFGKNQDEADEEDLRGLF